MKIKASNIRLISQGPQDKLKFISYIEQLTNTKPLHITTPERTNKAWVVDAWGDHPEDFSPASDRRSFINQMVQSYETKSLRLQKPQIQSQKLDHSIKMTTPIRAKKQSIQSKNQKQNRPRTRLYCSTKPAKRPDPLDQESGPFKIVLSSVVYPVLKPIATQRKSTRQKGRRIERFHSFVARSIRK